MKNKKGISLITLVITIVVIIILTGAIVLSISQNNPIGNANQAVATGNLATVRDQFTSVYSAEYTANLGDASKITVGNLKNNMGTIPTGITITTSGIIYTGIDNVMVGEAKRLGIDTVPIPTGFYYVKGSKSTGLVISSKNTDENGVNEGKKVADTVTDPSTQVAYSAIGDQFVWIPIDLISGGLIKRTLGSIDDRNRCNNSCYLYR